MERLSERYTCKDIEQLLDGYETCSMEMVMQSVYRIYSVRMTRVESFCSLNSAHNSPYTVHIDLMYAVLRYM